MDAPSFTTSLMRLGRPFGRDQLSAYLASSSRKLARYSRTAVGYGRMTYFHLFSLKRAITSSVLWLAAFDPARAQLKFRAKSRDMPAAHGFATGPSAGIDND